jgi:hypothetical protein
MRLDANIFWIYNYTMTTKKVRRGRPAKGSGESKSVSLLLRLAPSEKQGFQDAAELAGAPLTVWIRERLRTASRQELKLAGQQVPFVPDIASQ